MTTKILLTGANGAIGKELLRQNPGIFPVQVRYNDMSELYYNLPEADFLIHAGALVHSEDLPELIEANVGLTAQVLEAVKERSPATKVIFLSSMSMLDGFGWMKNPKHMSKYALSKNLAEQLVLAHENTYAVRFSTIFYGDPSRDGLSKIIHTAKTTGKCFIRRAERDFIPLERACSELLWLTYSDAIDGRMSINIGSGVHLSTWEVGELLKDNYGVEVAYGEPDTSDVCCFFPPLVNLDTSSHWSSDDTYDAIRGYYERI